MTIHALTVAKGILALSPMPGASGDYAADVDHIREWAPAMVLSLPTEAEMFVAGAGTFGADMQSRGTRWVHLPIEDFATPDDKITHLWPDVSRYALRALEGGGRVLVHCKAGIGRSGMVALRLMIELGEAPDEALARLRAVRPGAVETDAQLSWARKAVRAQASFVRHPAPNPRPVLDVARVPVKAFGSSGIRRII